MPQRQSYLPCPGTCLSTCQNTCLSTCQNTCLSTCPNTCLSTCPNTCLSTCPNTFVGTCSNTSPTRSSYAGTGGIYIVMAYIDMNHMVTARIVMAHIPMAYLAMTYLVVIDRSCRRRVWRRCCSTARIARVSAHSGSGRAAGRARTEGCVGSGFGISRYSV